MGCKVQDLRDFIDSAEDDRKLGVIHDVLDRVGTQGVI
jgi:hypothetical protein